MMSDLAHRQKTAEDAMAETTDPATISMGLLPGVIVALALLAGAWIVSEAIRDRPAAPGAQAEAERAIHVGRIAVTPAE